MYPVRQSIYVRAGYFVASSYLRSAKNACLFDLKFPAMTCWDPYLAIVCTIFAVHQAAGNLPPNQRTNRISSSLLPANKDAVTCTSVIKLINPKHSRRLHSHDIKYGSGSGQQSVTGTSSLTDSNSYWIVLPPHKETCVRGEEIKCGSIIRLGHLNTKCLLHSHLFKSPLSGSQEVSCFGKNLIGDTGDNWMVVCDDKLWSRKGVVSFRHVDTGKLFYGEFELRAAS
ncbi:hypothetical protein M513_10497 [Trichuris suis]|uniref:MIR domain-containing protein n=1 Tax=Trichuris suis TaxID=68888 RepID=A0A085LUJ6_9BILA|nr:hypothetical protein M513_10497 [Trichuris suis]